METGRDTSDADKQESSNASAGTSSNAGEFKVKRTRERELERKRARGEVSCAECRRLKLKCNKKVPCSSCVRRGCHAICPNGALSTGQGSRFVLANTRKLHSKLLSMSARIRNLEDALQIAQATISTRPHPLLSDNLLNIKSGVDDVTGENNPQTGPGPEDDEEEEDHVASALGTLSVSERGETRFIGRVAAEALLINQSADEVRPHAMHANSVKVEESLPDEIISAARGFPFMRAAVPRLHFFDLLEKHLPTYERATALAEAYLENVSWLPRPIQREQIFEEVIPLVYKHIGCQNRPPPEGETQADNRTKMLAKMHTLALIFALFACGAAADLTQEPQNAEGVLYSYVARAALNAHSVFDYGAAMETVQALQLVSTYDFFSCSSPSLESSWKVMSFGMLLAVSIGLHRDPARWGLDEKQIQRRRTLFWELSSIDKFKCLGSGRPAMFHLKEVDCEVPQDMDCITRADGSVQEGPYYWRIRFSRFVVGPIAETLSEMRPIKYSEILEFDRKIREFESPPFDIGSDDGKVDVYNIQGHLWNIYKDITILFLHRNFFARAMIKHSDNPLRSPFAPSFLAAYACSIKLTRTVRSCFAYNPEMLLRIWPIWAHTLTSGVIIGTVAARIKNAQLASAAFQDLNLTIDLFENAQKHPVSMKGLPMLIRLRDRALKAIQGDSVPKEPSPPPSGVKQEEDDPDFELAILRGGAQFIQAGWTRSRSGEVMSTSTRGNTGQSSIYNLLTRPTNVSTAPSESESPQPHSSHSESSPPASAENGSQSSPVTSPARIFASPKPAEVANAAEKASAPPTSGTNPMQVDSMQSPNGEVNRWASHFQSNFQPMHADTTEFDVDTLMSWLQADEASRNGTASSKNTSLLPSNSNANTNPMSACSVPSNPNLNADVTLDGPNPHLRFNFNTGDSPEGAHDITPDQGAAWFNQTFGPADAQAAATMAFSLTPFFQNAGDQTGPQQQQQQQQAFAGAGSTTANLQGLSAPSMFAPQSTGGSGSGSAGANTSMDYTSMWFLPGQTNGSGSGASGAPGAANAPHAQNGEDLAFMDAWRMQASIEEQNINIMPPPTSFQNLF